jgi:hypothetical protein
MLDPYPDRRYFGDPAARDPLGVQLYLRDLRYAYLKAKASALLLFAWRHVRQWFQASQQQQPKHVEPAFYTSSHQPARKRTGRR